VVDPAGLPERLRDEVPAMIVLELFLEDLLLEGYDLRSSGFACVINPLDGEFSCVDPYVAADARCIRPAESIEKMYRSSCRATS
jgi:hypothetical protein